MKTIGTAPKAPHTPCFTSGTEIATNRGPVTIDELRVGDLILTRDNGYRPVRWIGARRFDATALNQYPELHPICIPAGAIDRGVPSRDLVVSPQHRLLVTGNDALALGGETEILAAAVQLGSVYQAGPAEVETVIYYHLMFDAHEIIWANGCWSESFLPSMDTLEGLHSAQREEILKIFPTLATETGQASYPAARAGIMRAQPHLTLVA